MKAFSVLIILSVASSGAAAPTPNRDAKLIKTILDQSCVDMDSGKISGTTSYFQPDILVYDLAPPLISDAKAVQQGNVALHTIIDGPFHCSYEDVKVRMLGRNYAYSGSIIHSTAKLKSGGNLDIRIRSTDIWERTGTGWRAIHEHTSVPVDADGKAMFKLPLNTPGQ